MTSTKPDRVNPLLVLVVVAGLVGIVFLWVHIVHTNDRTREIEQYRAVCLAPGAWHDAPRCDHVNQRVELGGK